LQPFPLIRLPVFTTTLGLVFSACSPELAERYLIFGPSSENHAPTAVAFPELTNPRRLQSDLFEGFRGGVIGFHPYKEGSHLDIRYSIQNGVAILPAFT
jgi:hypothetical protein